MDLGFLIDFKDWKFDRLSVFFFRMVLDVYEYNLTYLNRVYEVTVFKCLLFKLLVVYSGLLLLLFCECLNMVAIYSGLAANLFDGLQGNLLLMLGSYWIYFPWSRYSSRGFTWLLNVVSKISLYLTAVTCDQVFRDHQITTFFNPLGYVCYGDSFGMGLKK